MNNSNGSFGSLTPIWTELSLRFPEDAYAWSMANLRVHGLPLYHLPALADIYRDSHPTVAVQKGSQIGLTQLMVHKALWAAFTNYADRGNVGLFMPTQSLAEQFAEYRLERAIQESPQTGEGRWQPQQHLSGHSLQPRRRREGHMDGRP